MRTLKHTHLLHLLATPLVVGVLACDDEPDLIHHDEPPVVTISGGPEGRTRDTQAHFALSCDREEGCTFECGLDGEGLAPCPADVAYEDLADGAYVFRAVAIDAGGMRSTGATRTWTVDTAAAEITDLSGPPDPTADVDATFTFGCSKSDCTFTCRLEGSVVGNVPTTASCASGMTYPDLADDTYTFTVQAADDLGNEGAPATWSFTLFTEGPIVDITDGPPERTADSDAVLAFVCNDTGGCTYECAHDTPDGATGAWETCESPATLPSLADGLHVFRVRATDGLHRTGPATSHSWTVVTVGPEVVITDGPPEQTGETEATFAFECVGAGTCTYECAVDGPDGTQGPFTPCTSPTTVPAPQEGLHTFHVRATDDLGNVGEPADRSWTVLGFVWESISAGSAHGCGIDHDGALWCWGSRGYGQLGIGGAATDAPDGPVTTPVRVGTESDWRQVSAGYRATCGIRGEGSLWCWGRNADGRLGVVGDDMVTEPARVGAENDWIDVATSRFFDGATCGIRDGGSLWCWGRNHYGQLGVGDTEHRDTPTPVGTSLGWTGIDVAGHHVCGIREGELWCWGRERDGTLGLGEDVVNPDPVRIGIRSDWASLALGSVSICGLTEDGALWCWGINERSQLGLGDTDDRDAPTRVEPERTFAAAAAGSVHACAIAPDRRVFCWGSNFDGRLGTGDLAQRSSPTLVPGLSSIASVTAGSTHTCVLTDGGATWCWGSNRNGQLGLPEHGWDRYEQRPVAGGGTWQDVSLAGMWNGIRNACGITTEGRLHCWGHNGLGQLGTGDLYGRKRPAPVGEATDWERVATAAQHSCGIRNGGELWCWGNNDYGQLGLDDTDPRDRPTRVGDAADWTSVSTKLFHTCGIRSGGSLWCWGRNGWGSLGQNDTEQRNAPVQVDEASWRWVFAGWYTTCGIRTDGTLWCWGRNQYGKLGVGGTSDRHVPTQVGSHDDWLEVETSSGHSCGIRDTDALYCWGGGHEGRLGIGSSPQEQTTPARVDAGTVWTQVSIGPNHTCALDDAQSLWCWGPNWNGRLGLPDYMLEDEWFETPMPIGEAGGWSRIVGGYAGTAGLRDDGALWTWGSNGTGALGNDTAWEASPVPVTAPDDD